VAMHEVGVHVGMRGMVGDKVWGDLTSQALTTKGEAFDRARKSVPANTPAHLKGEETLAYLVENAPHLPIVKRAISAIKNWARTTFGAKLSITESDIHHLAAKALRRESKTSERSVREGTAFSYVGKKAKGADTSALARATKMEKEGVDSESIRRDTGWFLGHDDNWRFEVDDFKAGFKQDFKSIPEKTNLTLGEVFDNPELYKQYPDAANITFEVTNPFFDWSKSSQGWYDEGRNKIVITPYAEDPRSTMLHEMQHWVQAKEGFAPGGNYNSVKDYDENLLDTLEKHIRNDVNKNEFLKKWEQDDIGKVRKSLSEINILHKDLSKLEDINSRLDKIKNSINEKMKSIESKTRSEYEEKYKSTKDRIAKNRVSTDALREEYYKLPYGSSEREQLSNRIDALDDENNRLHSESLTYINPHTAIRELNSKHEAQLSRLRELKYKTEDDIREHGKKLNALVPDAVKHKVYQIISGEVESRDVEARKDLTPKQRKETAPYSSQGVAKEDAIILAKTDKAKSNYMYSVAPEDALQEQIDRSRQRATAPPAPKKGKLGKSSTTFQKIADWFETKMFSHDAGLVNPIRRSLKAMNADEYITGEVLDSVTQSQTVNATSAAAQGASTGGLKYDGTTKFWEAVPDKNNLLNMRQIIEDEATSRGWTEQDTHLYFTHYMEARRLADLYDSVRKLEGKINSEQNDSTRNAYYKSRDRLKGVLDLSGISEQECLDTINAYKTVEGFVKAEEMWHKIRENVINTLVESGLYSKQQAENYLDAAFYSPFNRIMGDENQTIESVEDLLDSMSSDSFRAPVGSLTKGMNDQKLKGSERQVHLMVENMEQWVQLSYTRAILAKKGTDLIDASRRYLPEGSVKRVQGTKSDKSRSVTCYFHGKKQYWEFEDPLMAVAFKGTPAAMMMLRPIAAVSSMMRNGIVLLPTFTISQLPQDIYSAAFTSGIKNPFMLLPELVKEFSVTAFTSRDTEAHKALKSIGAVGTKDFADTRELHLHDAAYHTKLSNNKKITRKIKLALEQFAMAGDNAVRQAVYNRTLKELKGNPRAKAIAYQRAFDVINFRRRGASALLEQVRSVTPFLGAALQAQRAAYQVLAGRGLAHQDAGEVRRRLLTTSLTMMTMSLLYNMLYGGLLDDDDFNKKTTRDKDTRIFLFGGNSPISLPIRPDVFALPFVVGNHLFQLPAGNEHPRQTYEAMREAAFNALGAGIPIMPPAIKEPLQLTANYDFFTNRPIVAQRLQGREPEAQYDANTSALGKLVGQAGISPIKFDHFAKAWFSGVGTAVLGLSNMVNMMSSDTPDKAYSTREILRMIPSATGLIPKEHSVQATATSYDIREAVEHAHNTYNGYIKDGLKAEAKAFKEDNKALLNESVHKQVNLLKTSTDKIHASIRQIKNSKTIPSEEKTRRLDALEKKERVIQERASKLYSRIYP